MQTLAERLSTTANVGTVFGELIQGCGKTVISIARVRYCPGSGGGGVHKESRQGFLGGSRGGRVGDRHARRGPGGADTDARFVRPFDARRAAGLVAARRRDGYYFAACAALAMSRWRSADER